MLLENLAYPEVEAYLEEKRIVLVPIGSVEQHSPYGLIGTDFITAEFIARAAGESMKILVAPTISYGVSPHHMAFKGTATFSPATMIAVISDVVRSFLTHGFETILFVNGHGGNISTIETAFYQLKAQNTPGRFELVSWYELDGPREFVNNTFGDAEGSHATPGEVSVTRFARPAEFENKASHEQTVEKPNYHWPLTAEEMKAFFPDGRMESAPWLATAALGKQIVELAVASLEKEVTKIVQTS